MVLATVNETLNVGPPEEYERQILSDKMKWKWENNKPTKTDDVVNETELNRQMYLAVVVSKYIYNKTFIHTPDQQYTHWIYSTKMK